MFIQISLIPVCIILTLTNTHLSSSTQIGLPQCSDNIRNDIDNILTIPEAHSLPYGRAFIAKTFGVAFTFHEKSSSLPDSKLAPDKKSKSINIGLGYELKGIISPCALHEPLAIGHKQSLPDLCNVTFYGRLFDPEILIAHISSRFDASLQTCIWDVIFPPIEVPGTYSIEILTLWINDAEDPTPDYRATPIDERVNTGRIIHLGGMGIFPFFAVDQSWKKYNLDGLAVRPCQGYYYHYVVGKKIYLLRNNTLHEFPNTETLAHMGYDNKDVRLFLVAFVLTFPQGKPLVARTSPVTEEEYANGSYIRKPVISPELNTMLHNLKEIRLWRYDNPMRPFSFIYNLPKSITVNKNNVSKNFIKPIDQSLLPLCTSGENAGRWVKEPLCDVYEQNWGTGLMADLGSECAHSSTVYFYFEIKNRSTSMVWRPHKCRLTHHAVCGQQDVACAARNGMTIKHLDESKGLYLSAKACLAARGIGVIAGFGDSLGDEQWRNVATAIGQDVKFFEHSNSHGLVCRGGDGSLKNFHRMSNLVKLPRCVEESAHKMIAKTPQANTIILVTNFMIAHLLSGKEDMNEIKYLLQKQAEVHGALATRLMNEKNITYRRIYYSGAAAHGFRNAGFTASRMRIANAHARDILGKQGWEILDGYNVTLGRPDGTTDGHHYRGGVATAVSDVLMTMICNEK
eukprot:gene4414-8789_t